ncbi:MAG: hypothetical protein ACQEXV_13345 [Bacillota bacterium]
MYRIVPEEWRATGQTVLALLFFGVSVIIVASYAGGAVYEAFDGQTLYLSIAIMSFIGMVFGLILMRIYGRRHGSDTSNGHHHSAS